ncbi:hypothetical protein KEM48_007726 [Puccinia striiformis f. sp. tritici PST-130]|nr:hypothetical protein KEM48_007726 [Puccinia striiformis f. sp. tritici PST-130]
MHEIKTGVLERMPPPELKASVMGTVSEKRAVGSTRVDKDSLVDLMADIFGGGGDVSTPVANQPPKSSVNDILGLFGGDSAPATQAPPSSSITDCKSLSSHKKPNTNNILDVTAQFVANGLGPIQNVNFQAAVPKTQKLKMLAISNSDISPGITETQQLRIMYNPGATIRLRLRISYTSNGEAKQDQTDFSFPASVTA